MAGSRSGIERISAWHWAGSTICARQRRGHWRHTLGRAKCRIPTVPSVYNLLYWFGVILHVAMCSLYPMCAMSVLGHLELVLRTIARFRKRDLGWAGHRYSLWRRRSKREQEVLLWARERQGKQPQDVRKSLTGGKAPVDQGGLEPSIFKLRALRSASWARHPWHTGNAPQILEESWYIQTGSHTQKATATSKQPRTERADTDTASVSREASEKVEMEATLRSGCGAPFWRISADGVPVFVCTLKGRDKKRYIVRTGSQCLFVPCLYLVCTLFFLLLLLSLSLSLSVVVVVFLGSWILP